VATRSGDTPVHSKATLSGAPVVGAPRRVDGAGAVDRAGRDEGDVDPGARDLPAQPVREGADPGLGGAVDDERREGCVAEDRPDVDDVAAPALDHAGQQAPGQVDRRQQVQRHHRVEVVDGDVDHVAEPGEPGVVHEHVDGADAGHEPLPLVLVREVGGEGGDGAVGLLDELVELRLGAGHGDHVGSRSGEVEGHGTADAA
jgi:hypothetical protein